MYGGCASAGSTAMRQQFVADGETAKLIRRAVDVWRLVTGEDQQQFRRAF